MFRCVCTRVNVSVCGSEGLIHLKQVPKPLDGSINHHKKACFIQDPAFRRIPDVKTEALTEKKRSTGRGVRGRESETGLQYFGTGSTMVTKL